MKKYSLNDYYQTFEGLRSLLDNEENPLTFSATDMIGKYKKLILRVHPKTNIGLLRRIGRLNMTLGNERTREGLAYFLGIKSKEVEEDGDIVTRHHATLKLDKEQKEVLDTIHQKTVQYLVSLIKQKKEDILAILKILKRKVDKYNPQESKFIRKLQSYQSKKYGQSWVDFINTNDVDELGLLLSKASKGGFLRLPYFELTPRDENTSDPPAWGITVTVICGKEVTMYDGKQYDPNTKVRLYAKTYVDQRTGKSKIHYKTTPNLNFFIVKPKPFEAVFTGSLLGNIQHAAGDDTTCKFLFQRGKVKEFRIFEYNTKKEQDYVIDEEPVLDPEAFFKNRDEGAENVYSNEDTAPSTLTRTYNFSNGSVIDKTDPNCPPSQFGAQPE